MPYREDRGLGDIIAGIVDDCVSSQEFERLNNSIRRTIDEVFDELHIDTGGSERQSYGAGDWAMGRRRGEEKYSYGEGARRWSEGGEARHQDGRLVRDSLGRFRYAGEEFLRKYREAKPELYAKNPPGQIGGFLATVFGGLLTGIFGFSLFATIIGTIFIPSDRTGGIIASFLLLPFLLGSIALLRFGLLMQGRLKRFRAYVSVLDGKSYVSIADLAAAVGKSEAFVRKDLRAMIDKKFFPRGRLDAQQTTLMLDDETWRQYQETAAAYEERAKEAKQKEESRLFDSIEADDPELQAAIREGERYISKIREANDAIPGEEITRKLDRLEMLMRKIFLVLQQKPDQLPKLRKFMNYYMPTTDKLVQTYRELDSQPIEGENISSAKAEIEETIDTINDAYEKLLDSFYMEAAMDVRSDIAVLQNLMAQEGLTDQPFSQPAQAGTPSAQGAAQGQVQEAQIK